MKDDKTMVSANDRIYDLLIIGGGPAGLAAAVSARESGIKDILILERDKELGGILNQCIHNGFGLHTFKEELTGPEYAKRFIDMAVKEQIAFELNTMVVDISEADSAKTDFTDVFSYKIVTAVSKQKGIQQLKTKAVILAMGCRERARGSLNTPGYRPAGIYSAGTAQRLVNMEGFMPGREVVILGSGDIGLIMARRMTLEGARVKLVAELMPYSGGLKRNIVQCLNDFDIPLKLSHTVIDIDGEKRVKGVTIAKVDENRNPIPGTEEYVKCDTLLLSVGLLPENELSRKLGVEMGRVTGGPIVNESLETSVEGVFACGNVLHVHDLVDYVSEEAKLAGVNAAKYIKGQRIQSVQAEAKKGPAGKISADKIKILAVDGVRYTVPMQICPAQMEEHMPLRFRVGSVYKDSYISVYFGEERILHKKKNVLAPGEMETVLLSRAQLLQHPKLETITVKIEEA